VVEAVFTGGEPGPAGMVLDFDEASGALEEAVSDLDHSCLNDLEPFASTPPTAENLARLVYGRLLEAAGAGRWSAVPGRVTVWESRDCWASYGPG